MYLFVLILISRVEKHDEIEQLFIKLLFDSNVYQKFFISKKVEYQIVSKFTLESKIKN